MNNDDWKIQVSIKSSASKDADMINVRANTADELSVLLEGVSDYSTQIAATAKMVQAAYNTLPLATPASTPATTPPVSSAADPIAEASGGLAEETIRDRYGNVWVYNKPGAPTCIRGTMVLKSGVSQAGKAYKCWSDPAAGPKWSGEKIPKEQHAPIIWA
jgi:hypothetical protein